jgi:hypothetical protein
MRGELVKSDPCSKCKFADFIDRKSTHDEGFRVLYI